MSWWFCTPWMPVCAHATLTQPKMIHFRLQVFPIVLRIITRTTQFQVTTLKYSPMSSAARASPASAASSRLAPSRRPALDVKDWTFIKCETCNIYQNEHELTPGTNPKWPSYIFTILSLYFPYILHIFWIYYLPCFGKNRSLKYYQYILGQFGVSSVCLHGRALFLN